MAKRESKQSKGGKARAANLSPEDRSISARKAAEARWANELDAPEVICGSTDQPMRIGDIELPCYVLEDERRVLVQRGMMTALDMSQGTAGRGDGDRLARFLATKSIKRFVEDDLRDVITNPIRFKVGGNVAYGYEATVLADICNAVLTARRIGKLNYQQEHIADQCEILLSAFAKVGIIALVDEATGFQYVRQRNALEELLSEIISDELRRYVGMFPGSYFKELCRLRNVTYRPDMKLPQYFGHLTNDIIYKRLSHGVLEKLKERNPRSNGKRKHKHFQWLSDDLGHPMLVQHLGAVVALMRISKTYDEFKQRLDMVAPVYDEQSLFQGLDGA